MTLAWKNSQEISALLEGDGWVSPNTYCNRFSPLVNKPAVYLFHLIKTYDYTEGLVAYVGMSARLKQRIASHNILPELEAPGFWTKVWFKSVPASDLREVEASYITQFDPPWNIQGRRRGGLLQ